MTSDSNIVRDNDYIVSTDVRFILAEEQNVNSDNAFCNVKDVTTQAGNKLSGLYAYQLSNLSRKQFLHKRRYI